MAKVPLNIIHKQVLEISTDNVKDAQEIERRYMELIKQINTPSFENCFEDLLPPDQHLLIERMEIDLGKFNKNNLFNELGTHLNFALREALKKNISKKISITIEKDKNGQTARSNGSHETLIGTGIGKTSETLSLLKGPFEIFAFFLEKGRLPNWVPLNFRFEEDWVEALDDQQLVQLKKLIQKSEQALLRLTSHFPVPFILKILEHFTPVKSIFDNWKWIDAYLLTTALDKALFKRNYWSYVLSWCFVNVQEKPVSASIKEGEILFKALKKLPENLLVSMKLLLVEQDIPETLQRSMINSLDGLISDYKSDKGKTEKEKSSLKFLSPFEDQIDSRNTPTAPGEETLQTPASQAGMAKAIQEEISTDEEPIWVSNAGLALLSPFITELFQSCDFLDKGLFKSLEMSARAVNVLVHLAHGMEEVPEYQKLLPKLFCGILWETVLPEISPVSDLERSNAEELLKAVVNHWKALGNSSPEAVQEAFIRRPGKLIPGNPALLLEVEKKTQDILLKKLPWGFSMIKLRWMPSVLQVKWI